MNITKIIWSNYYELPDIVREAATLAVLVILCICTPPNLILFLITLLFLGLAGWSSYYKTNKW